jgi:Trp operon repressor
MKLITDMMRKEMTRKEFLATLGFGVATVAGFSTILKMLGKNNPWQHDNQSVGYGSGAYGGSRKT